MFVCLILSISLCHAKLLVAGHSRKGFPLLVQSIVVQLEAAAKPVGFLQKETVLDRHGFVGRGATTTCH